MARFNVVFAREDGGLEVHRMKEWLRLHPEHIPDGLDATKSTSHQLRDGLRRMDGRFKRRQTRSDSSRPEVPQLRKRSSRSWEKTEARAQRQMRPKRPPFDSKFS
jgi:hypothetical protein